MKKGLIIQGLCESIDELEWLACQLNDTKEPVKHQWDSAVMVIDNCEVRLAQIRKGIENADDQHSTNSTEHDNYQLPFSHDG